MVSTLSKRELSNWPRKFFGGGGGLWRRVNDEGSQSAQYRRGRAVGARKEGLLYQSLVCCKIKKKERKKENQQ